MQAKATYEVGNLVTAEFGPSLDFYLKPRVRLQDITTFDLDDSKSRPLVFSIGYRYLLYPGSPPTSIGSMASSLGTIAIDCRSNPTRKFARTTSSPTPAPNSSTKSQYSKWAETAIYLGCFFPIGKQSKSTPTTNTRTRPAKAPTCSTTSSG
jgi:hypothetical protein